MGLPNIGVQRPIQSSELKPEGTAA
jgi:hypothetical protein